MSHSTAGIIFASRLREERERAGLSQIEFARRLSGMLDDTIDPSAMTRIEKGKRTVKIDEAVAIAQLLDVELMTLLTDTSTIDRHLEIKRAALLKAHARLQQARDDVRQLELSVRVLEGEREASARGVELPDVEI
ncbi:helix-turn-helix domain-containing protein [Spelaeicoccus albus]|uniref:Transcriptional regulator with XRE-family HTH domain n=1 Tax=Spelaeicoccus albus TaxID=1280376 RepID=A0A7Z0D1D4_9MICO|nr:helix-turn-helix transcriptional regulator [Spelaeicoccus albus]NYI66072.1 transcriptional regulator with XRE-family HTH domain [Spelaeicoccus albus]